MLHCDFAHLQALGFECVYGCKGNLYASNTLNTNSNPRVQSNHGKETNRIYRDTFGLNHRGTWSNGISTNSYVQYERTPNTQLNEGLTNGDSKITKLDNFLAHSEVSVPFEFGVAHPATLGTEWNPQRMRDGTSTNQTLMGSAIPGMGNGTRSHYASAHFFPLFAGDNIELTDSTMLMQACVTICTSRPATIGARR